MFGEQQEFWRGWMQGGVDGSLRGKAGLAVNLAGQALDCILKAVDPGRFENMQTGWTAEHVKSAGFLTRVSNT